LYQNDAALSARISSLCAPIKLRRYDAVTARHLTGTATDSIRIIGLTPVRRCRLVVRPMAEAVSCALPTKV
jgi:hypothetical protein